MADSSDPTPRRPSVLDLPTRDLLQLYSELLDELLRRQVIRSRNAPAGDLAETLVVRAYDGELAPPSAKSWDVRAADGRLLQVKCRVVNPARLRGNYSFFRSWDFDACVFIQLGPTYSVVRAVEVPAASIKATASTVAWVNGSRIQVRAPLVTLLGAIDVTKRVRAALRSLDDASAPASPPSG